MSISLLIVESNAFVRAGLRVLLEEGSGIEICGLCATADEAISLCGTTRPDVVILDLHVARQMPVDQVRNACGGDDGGGLLIFLDQLQEEEIFEFLTHGVSGFVAKRDEPATLVAAIQAVAGGDDVWLSPRVSKLLVRKKKASSPDAALTDREREVLRAMALGHANAEIAEECRLSDGSVRNLVSAIYRKLGVNSRAAAVAWAWKSGLMGEGDI